MDTTRLLTDGLLVSLSDADTRRSIQLLNELFTTRRGAIHQYGLDEQLVSAYAAFYMPTNMQKLAFMMSQLQTLPVDVNAPFEVVDFGCGSGTYAFAAAEYLGPTDGVYHLVDSSMLMLAQAKKVQQLFYPEMNATFGKTIPTRQPDRARMAVLGNVINEMNVEQINGLLRQLDADVLVLIEPGTQASFATVAQVRTQLLSTGYAVQYPCPNAGVCPVMDNADEWCHQVLKAALPPEIARLGQLAGLDRTVMPFIGHVYTKVPQTEAPAVLFRLKTHSKHAFFWEACMQTTDGLAVKSLELPKKPFSKKEQKALLKVNAGERLSFEVVKELKNGTLRIGGPVFGVDK